MESIRLIFRKIHKEGILYCFKRLLGKIQFILRHWVKISFYGLDNLRAAISSSKCCIDSVLAIYDLRSNPYSFNFTEFLARAEVYRIKNFLTHIDLVFVIDKKTRHRGDQADVTDSNYRNWILNLAECAEPLKSISSISIFDDTRKFLSFYHKARYAHKIYPEAGALYLPQASYHLKYVSDYYRSTGFVPKFESSGILLDWAEKYFFQNCYPLLPVVVLVRNSDIQLTRNTPFLELFDFFRRAVSKYPVKFFVVNDFCNPVKIPADLSGKVIVSPEATISVKYRVALMQKTSFIISSVCGGPFVHCFFMDTPYLVFGLDNDVFSAKWYITEHGMNDDLRVPWATNYQRAFPEYGDAEYIFSRFEELYDLLKKDNRLIPISYNLK